MKSAPRLYLLVLAGITILMIIENWVGDIDNRTRYNYKSEIQSRLSLHLRKVVASNIKVKRPFIQSSDHGIINSRPKSKKMLFTIENSDLSFPDSLPGWGKLPKIDDGDWKLSVNSRLKDGADSEYILNRRKQAQNECRPKNLGTDFYRIYEPIAMRYWDMMTEPSIKTAQRKFLDFRARRIIKRPPQGKGIVIVSQGDSVSAIALILLLKEKGSELPVELWHVERNWLNEEQIEYLNSLGHVSIRYASDHAQYDIKAAMMKTSVVATALFYSAFEEMLYLSADSIPLQNMDLLFNTQDYMSHGAVFWPGFSSTYSGNPIWDILGISCIYEQEAESSILLVNRKMKNVNDALKVSMFLQSEWKLYSRLVPDPFDLFRLVFRSLEASYHMITDIPALVGNDYKYQFCGRSLVHFYPRRGSETPKEANLILLKLLDNEKDRIHEGTMQFFQYYPNYISNYAWIGIKEKCHQLKQYNSNYFTGIPPRTTVFKAIVPGLNMKLNAMANRASRLTT